MKRDETFEAVEEVACAAECTGLMPAIPPDPSGAQNLAGLMAIHCPPYATAPNPARPLPPGEDARPSDAHNSLRSTPSARPAKAPAPSRPGSGRNP